MLLSAGLYCSLVALREVRMGRQRWEALLLCDHCGPHGSVGFFRFFNFFWCVFKPRDLTTSSWLTSSLGNHRLYG